MIMGDNEEFECITETSALQTKKNYQSGLNDTQMFLISPIYPLKLDLHTE